MLIVSRVCAEFHDEKGNVLMTVHPYELGSMLEAPETIKADPLFQMLVNDGSLKAVQSVADKKQLENDPMQGVDAEGKNKTDAALAKLAKGEKAEGTKKAAADKKAAAEK